MDCVVHPGVKAPYECSRCHAFVCAECQVKVEGALLCRACFAALHKQLADRFLIETRSINYPMGAAAGIAAALAVAFLWAQLAAWIGYLVPFGVAVLGGAVGAAVVRGAGGKRSEKLQELAAVITLLGAAVEWSLAAVLTRAPVSYGTTGYESAVSAALHSLPISISQELHLLDWIFLGLGVVWSWWVPHVRTVPE